MKIMVNGNMIDGAAAETLIGPPPVPDTAQIAYIPLPLMRQRVEKLGMLQPFASYLAQYPEQQMLLLTLQGGLVDPAHPAIIDAFDAMSVPPSARAYILAPPSAGVGDPPAMG